MRRFLPSARLWGEIWRVLLAMAVGALVYLVNGLSVEVGDVTARFPLLLAIDPLLGLLACGLMLLRRRWPLPVVLGTGVISGVAATATGATLISFVSLCTRRRWREVAVAGVFLMVTALVWERMYPSGTTSELIALLVTQALALAACLGIGAYIGVRREHVSNLRARAETAEREQASRVAEARATERARIAREMHDVLAHRISLIAMHSGALSYREDLPPEQVREIAGLLRDNADHAVHELRAVLGVLRGPGEPEQSRVPQPDLGRLDALLEEVAAAGTRVELDHGVDGEPPDAQSRTAYRVVQETLTNARKHAPHATVHLRLAGGPDTGLELEVRNRVRTPWAIDTRRPAPAGVGLAGLGERVDLSGGRLSHGIDRDGWFVVRAWLPWHA